MQIAAKCVAGWMAVCALAVAPILRAQEVGAPPTPPKPASVEITPVNSQAHVGDRVKFTAVAKDASGKVMDVKPMLWIALPPDIAGADADGNVIFRTAGQVTVGAVVAGKPGFTTATVVTPPPAKIEVEPVEKALAVGGSTVLTASARSANGDPRTDVAIHWSSKAPAIAKVDESGLVKALAPGRATLVATGGPARGEISVQVVADTLQRIALEPAATTAKTGDVVHFTAKPIAAKGAATSDLLTSWSVSGPQGRIYADGAFVANLPGTYEVTAVIGGHTASAAIEVAPRNVQRGLEVVAHIPTKDAEGKVVQTSEEWVVGNHLYVATMGDRLYAYDVSDPAHPKALDSLKADARL